MSLSYGVMKIEIKNQKAIEVSRLYRRTIVIVLLYDGACASSWGGLERGVCSRHNKTGTATTLIRNSTKSGTAPPPSPTWLPLDFHPTNNSTIAHNRAIPSSADVQQPKKVLLRNWHSVGQRARESHQRSQRGWHFPQIQLKIIT